ncbi:uncharacterized protein LOC141601346 [Silene latifolia]|uniref:uncharacterized protein LOC141601346 n=1 Tax=Silene latifolia TaxID=37657 RepID=UPI003D7716B2
MAKKPRSKFFLNKQKIQSKGKLRLTFTNTADLHLDNSDNSDEMGKPTDLEIPAACSEGPVIPQSSDAKTTLSVSEIVGIPVLNPDIVVETVESEVSEAEDEPGAEEPGWTQVTGKRRPNTPFKQPIQITLDDVKPELEYWSTEVICYVLGGNPPWAQLSGFNKTIWGQYKYDKVSFLPNGAFLVHFPTMESRDLVLKQGFLMFGNKPLVVKPWTETASLAKKPVKAVPVWIHLCGLGLKFRGASSLEKIASLIGKFMRADASTMDKTKISYARLMVEIKIGQEFPDRIYFKDEKGADVSVGVEYEWKPVSCGACKGIGHTKEACIKKAAAPRIIQPPASVDLVPETPFGDPTHHDSSLIPIASPILHATRQELVTSSSTSPGKTYAEAVSPTKDKGKSIDQVSIDGGESSSSANGFLEFETKIKEHDFFTVLHKLGHYWEGVNNNSHYLGGRVWIIWLPQLFSIHLLASSDQHITVEVIEISSGDSFWYTVVYGFNSDGERQRLWSQINNLKDNCSKPWCICGDFNSLLNYNERLGSDVTWKEIRDFRQCMSYCEVNDIQAYGSFYTWKNKQDPTTGVFSRIDRFLVNIDWILLYPDSKAYFMNESNFDHCPCIVSRKPDIPARKLSFRYFNMWSLDPQFKEIIQHEWNRTVVGVKMYQMVTKLRNLKKPLKLLNKNKFSDVERTADMARLILDDLQTQLHQNPNDTQLSLAEREAADSYATLQKAKISYLKQKSKDPQDIEKAFLEYYEGLLGTSNHTTKVHKATVRSGKVVDESLSNILLQPVTHEEIKSGFFSIAASKSPGPDGFNSQFFKDSWEIVGPGICDAIKDFFSTGKLLKQLNTTNITLIPKVSNPTSVLEFRPIACCNIIYKCIPKLLCNKLGKVLPDLVSINQGGFIKGRNIVENVLICQDLVRLYNRKAASPRCLVNIHLRKAYDSVEWDFISHMLHHMKSPAQFIGWIMSYVTSPTYSLTLNGNSFGFFKGKCGLRQGDPLSPLLFTICMDYLSRILNVVGQQDDFRFHPMCGHLRLNHLLFADDLLLFSKGTDTSIMWLLRDYATFSAASGLSLNKEKTEIYFNGVQPQTMEAILPAYSDDCWMGKQVAYTVNEGYNWLRGPTPEVSWWRVCWNTMNVPKASFIYWAVVLGRLLTKDRLVLPDVCSCYNKSFNFTLILVDLSTGIEEEEGIAYWNVTKQDCTSKSPNLALLLTKEFNLCALGSGLETKLPLPETMKFGSNI